MTQGRHGIGTTLIVIAVVVILAIATMAFVTLTSQSNTSTRSSTSPTSSTKCSGSRGSEVWNSSNPTPYEEHTPVLLMSPNTTGYVCVTYQTAWQGNQTLYHSDPAYSSSPFLVNGSYTPCLSFHRRQLAGLQPPHRRILLQADHIPFIPGFCGSHLHPTIRDHGLRDGHLHHHGAGRLYGVLR